MGFKLAPFLIVALVSIPVLGHAAPRSLRSTGLSRDAVVNKGQVMGADFDTTTLRYHEDHLGYFQPIPNDYGDDLYNVRFTPTFWPYWLFGAYVPIFEPPDTVGGPIGTPGLRVTVYTSVEIDEDPGYPGELIGSVDVPFEDLTFSDIEVQSYNYVDLRPLGWQSNDRTEFHIAVTVIADSTDDSLMIFSDDGNPRDPSDRAGLLFGTDSSWMKVRDISGWEMGFVWAIQALISDSSNWPDAVDWVTDGASLFPHAVILDPAYPNPFNSTATLRFAVPMTAPYRLELFDHRGRLVGDLGSGVGGSGRAVVNAAGLSTGVYLVRLNTPSGSATQRLMLTR